MLTAAHCVDGDRPGDFKVKAGAHSKTGPQPLLDVAQIIVHPDYRSSAGGEFFIQNTREIIEGRVKLQI